METKRPGSSDTGLAVLIKGQSTIGLVSPTFRLTIPVRRELTLRWKTMSYHVNGSLQLRDRTFLNVFFTVLHSWCD